MLRQSAVGLLLAATIAAAQDCSVCQSYGTDFQDGGSYFQNIDSSADFTAHEAFSGCQNDTANNILVDPNGVQYLCTDTDLTPSNTSEPITCPIEQSQMFTGNWSLLVVSNNGDCAPIDYQRQFFLSVGPQATVTYTPTVTSTSTTTIPDISASTITQHTTITASPVHTTVDNWGFTALTITPLPSVSVSVVPAFTLTETETFTSTVLSTTTALPSPPATWVPDQPNFSISITIDFSILPTPLFGRKSLPLRRALNPLAPRDPDPPTITLTASPTTITSTVSSTTTLRTTLTDRETATITPTVTVNGLGPISIYTAPRSTETLTVYDVFSPAVHETSTTVTTTRVVTVTAAA